MPFTSQFAMCSMLHQVKPSPCTAMKRLVSCRLWSAQVKAAWKPSGRFRSSSAAYIFMYGFW